MANLNRVQLIGNLTRDPELRYTKDGTAVCDLSLAINRKYKNSSGAIMEEVTYVDITCWLKNAERVAEWAKKGTSLLVEGRLHLDQWENKEDGKPRQKLKVIMDYFQVLNRGRGRDEGNPEAPQTETAQATPEIPQDEIPF